MAQTEHPGCSKAADREHRLIVAGFGGQGILTLGRLLCMAAVTEGKMVTYLPSYGSEVRGGTARCEVVIGRGTIYSPVVEAADALLILNQLSYERFIGRLKPGGLLVVNSSGVDMDEVEKPAEAVCVALPAAEKAAEMGDVRAGNVIMLGAFVRASKLIRPESCRQALAELFTGRKADALELNLKAFDVGTQTAASALP